MKQDIILHLFYICLFLRYIEYFINLTLWSSKCRQVIEKSLKRSNDPGQNEVLWYSRYVARRLPFVKRLG